MNDEAALTDALAASYPTARFAVPFPGRGTTGADRYAIMQSYNAEAEAGADYALLVPASTETRWFQEWCFRWEVLFPQGRVKPDGYDGSPPWPPAIVIMGPAAERGAVRFSTVTPSGLRHTRTFRGRCAVTGVDPLEPPLSYHEAYASEDPRGTGKDGRDGKEPPSQGDLSPIAPISPIVPNLPKLDEAALHGPAGAYVRAVAPTTEAHPAGILASVLVGFGSMVGRGPYLVSGEPHRANEAALLVGGTAKARKGTALGCGRRLLVAAEEGFETRIRNGFGSGEALIHAVSPDDDGDHRLLIEEHEMARVVKTAARQGSVLSEIVRDAFDGRTLRHATLTRGTIEARDAHVSVLGSITRDELVAVLADVDVSNGFANRFVFVLVARTASKPRVQPLPDRDLSQHARAFNAALIAARTRARVEFSPAGGDAYDAAYEDITADDPPDPLGKVIARADAHLTRFTLLYALLDQARQVEPEHVAAAAAFWRYCRDSAAMLWPTDPLAERIRLPLTAAGPSGLTRTEIRAVVGSNNVPARRIEQALDDLVGRDIAVRTFRDTGGRRAEVWISTAHINTNESEHQRNDHHPVCRLR